MILDPEHTGFKLFRGFMGLTGARKGRGFAYKSFAALEKTGKVMQEILDLGEATFRQQGGPAG